MKKLNPRYPQIMKHLIYILVILSFTECKSSKETITETKTGTTETIKPNVALDGKWSIHSIGTRVITSNDKAMMSFKGQQLSATVGCNNHSGTIKKDGNKISFSDVFATEMYCQDLDALEKEMYTQLMNTSHYELSGELLYLKDLDDQSTFVLNR